MLFYLEKVFADAIQSGILFWNIRVGPNTITSVLMGGGRGVLTEMEEY